MLWKGVGYTIYYQKSNVLLELISFLSYLVELIA